MTRTPLPLRTRVVERDGPQSRLLLLLHGYGESSDMLTERLHLIDPDARWLAVVPGAPFERRGRAIWHRALSVPEVAGEQYHQSLVSLDALLGQLEVELDLPAAEAVVGGFSQGGGLGLGLLMAADVAHRPAAGFGVCSFPPAVAGFRVDRRAAQGRPYFLSSAREDHFAPIESSRSGASLLRATGIDLTYVESDGGHVMTDESAVQVGAWLSALADDRIPERGPDLLAGVSPRDEFYEELWELVS